MKDDSSQKIYQCVHCGHQVSELYRDFKKGIIKISHCNRCNEVADKYIEYDSVIIFLDILLLQRPAYRHILINKTVKGYWRFLLVLWLCDALTKLMQRKADKTSPPLEPDSVFYSALEFDFYQDYIFSAAESLVFFITVLGLKILWQYWKFHCNLSKVEMESVLRALVISSMGRLLVVPALIWGKSHSTAGVALTYLFVAASNVQALRVVSRAGRLWQMTALVILGYSIQAAVAGLFPHYASSLSVFYSFKFDSWQVLYS